jgi:hypothetical protein
MVLTRKKWNSKGQIALVSLMIGVFIFMLGMGFIDPIKDVISETRGVSQLDCSNNSITDGAKMTCLAVDLILPYFIVVVLGVAGAWISARFIA